MLRTWYLAYKQSRHFMLIYLVRNKVTVEGNVLSPLAS